ncbi:MAG TPA: hypothetical protein VNX68_00990 [Nitrosopumilaceae archaeon]|jgi:hypothetical protein|nr:hypothetical protein [Nitrosopumilaceae archaeon]
MDIFQDATFIGYQEQLGGLKPLPLFNITKRTHYRCGSTVSALTLEKEGLKIPYVPSFEEWKKEKTL